MPFCPRCRTEYLEGQGRCVDCGTLLVAELPPVSTEQPGEPVKEVALATFSTWTEAEMCAEQLQGEGIPSVLVPLGPGAGGWGSSAFVPHELRVRASDVERAREILDEGPSS